MKHPSIIAWLALLLSALVASCATIGEPTPQTFNERLAAGIGTVSAIRSTAASLLNQGKISVEDAKNIQQQSDVVRSGLDVASKIHATDPNAGNARLTAAVTALQALQLYLQSRSKE